MKNLGFSFCLMLFCLTNQAQTVPLDKIDEIFAEWTTGEQPGGSLGIFKEGTILYSKGYGFANLDYAIPNQANSVFRIASTSKQFTAACIIWLAEQGQLNLDDPLSNYFPNFPSYADEIKIHHLLHHTSGVRDYLQLSYLAGMGNEDYYTDEEVMRWLENQQALNFSPGEEHLYSNSGYWLLGQLVEKVSGKNMAEYAEETIFKPLGMASTHFHNNAQAIVKNRAYGYTPNGDEFEISMTQLDMIGDGGIFTTVEDFKKWDDDYYNPKVFTANFWKVMCTEGILNNGEKTGYAGGLSISKYQKQNLIAHGGAFVGFRTQFYRFPDHKLTIVLFTNRADGNPTPKVRAIADLIFDKKEKEASEKPIVEAKVISLKNGKNYIGTYVEDPGASFKVELKADTLWVTQSWNNSNYPILPTDQGTFIIEGAPNAHFTFDELKKGTYQKMILQQNGNSIPFTQGEEYDASKLKLEEFAGEYYSIELNCRYLLYVEEDNLKFKINNLGSSYPMVAIEENNFTGGGRTLSFKTKANGAQATEFEVDGGRVKGVKFIRQ